MRISFCLLIGACIIFFGCNQVKEKKNIESGVSLLLSKERKSRISNTNYNLFFDIPSLKTEPINAVLNLSFELNSNKNRILLDFKEQTNKILSVKKGQTPIAIKHENDHLVIDPKNLTVGKNEFEISFIAGDLSLNRNDEFLYTLLVPDRARTLFPLFDQPNLKSTYELTLSIPTNWEAVSNGQVKNRETQLNKDLITFAKTQAISSYLFAFAAGQFEKITDPNTGMTMFHREKDTVKVNRNAPEIFALHQKSIDWLEAYTGIKYPYEKFDFALIPPFQYGGMEHPGSVFYREASLFLDEGASINQQLRRASLIAHETAHMWFGNLVTMDWFNDVWLKEVFANQMASKIMHPNFPDVNHDLNFLLSYYPRAIEVDRSEGSHPIQQQLDNLQNAGTLYGNIIYNKAPIVMRNLERLMGKDNFQKALQDYLTAFAGKNATWDDLISIMEQYTDKDLNQWNQDWVKTKGMPSYVTALDDNRSHLTFEQITQGAIGQSWPQSIAYSGTFDLKSQSEIYLEENRTEIPHKNGNQPTIFNVNGKGYGYFKTSEKAWKSSLEVITKLGNETERAAFWMNTWEAIIRGDLPGPLIFEVLLKAIEKEENPLIVNYQTNRLSDIFYSFMSPQNQLAVAKNTENLLYQKILNTNNPSIKRLVYNALTRITSSENGSKKLHDIWQSKGQSISLKLSESELVNLSYQISLREVLGAENILSDQLSSIKNEDRKKQMEFVMQALSTSEAERDAFFNSLKNPKNRSSEPWVLQALNLLHHPLRQQSSQKYVLPSLEMIEEIQETGDIFFPARWLGSTLSQYNSPAITKEVRDFLKANPDLSPKLRNKILQAADMVFRSSAINKENIPTKP